MPVMRLLNIEFLLSLYVKEEQRVNGYSERFILY